MMDEDSGGGGDGGEGDAAEAEEVTEQQEQALPERHRSWPGADITAGPEDTGDSDHQVGGVTDDCP